MNFSAQALLFLFLIVSPGERLHAADEKTLDQWQREARAFETQQAWMEAEKTYLKMEEFFADQALSWFLAGRFLTEQKRFEEAVAHFEKGLEKDPESETAHLYLARLYLQLGNPLKSQEHSKKVLEIQEKIKSLEIPAPTAKP